MSSTIKGMYKQKMVQEDIEMAFLFSGQQNIRRKVDCKKRKI